MNETTAEYADRLSAAKAAKLKRDELDALVHSLPHDHPLRAAMRHALSKLWMFALEALGPEFVRDMGKQIGS